MKINGWIILLTTWGSLLWLLFVCIVRILTQKEIK